METPRVSFEEATTALLDPLSKTATDPSHSVEDYRFITFGMSARRRLLVVSYTERGKIIRLISARLAQEASEKFTKNVRHEFVDSLRAEYQRSDFGEMVEGKYAFTQLEFAELVRLLVTCVCEDEMVNLVQHSIGNQHARHKQGDWTYEIDDAHRITLRYWLNEFRNIEEAVPNSPSVTTPEERSELQKLILHHLRTLKARVDQVRS